MTFEGRPERQVHLAVATPGAENAQQKEEQGQAQGEASGQEEEGTWREPVGRGVGDLVSGAALGGSPGGLQVWR